MPCIAATKRPLGNRLTLDIGSGSGLDRRRDHCVHATVHIVVAHYPINRDACDVSIDYEQYATARHLANEQGWIVGVCRSPAPRATTLDRWQTLRRPRLWQPTRSTTVSD